MINNQRNHIEQTGKIFYKFIIEKFKKGHRSCTLVEYKESTAKDNSNHPNLIRSAQTLANRKLIIN